MPIPQIRKLSLTTKGAVMVRYAQQRPTGLVPLIAVAVPPNGKTFAFSLPTPNNRDSVFKIRVEWPDGTTKKTYRIRRNRSKTISRGAAPVLSGTPSSSGDAVDAAIAQAASAVISDPAAAGEGGKPWAQVLDALDAAAPAIGVGPPTRPSVPLQRLLAQQHTTRGRKAIRDLRGKSASGARRMLVRRGFLRKGRKRSLRDWNSRTPPGSSLTWKQHYAKQFATSPATRPATGSAPRFGPTSGGLLHDQIVAVGRPFDPSAILAANALTPVAKAIHDKLVDRIYGQTHHDVVEEAVALEKMVSGRKHSQASVEVSRFLATNAGKPDAPSNPDAYHAAVMEGAVKSGALLDSLDVVNEVPLIIETGDEFIGTKNMAPDIDVTSFGDEFPLGTSAALTAAPATEDIPLAAVDEDGEVLTDDEPFYKNPMVLAGGALVAAGAWWLSQRD